MRLKGFLELLQLADFLFDLILLGSSCSLEILRRSLNLCCYARIHYFNLAIFLLDERVEDTLIFDDRAGDQGSVLPALTED